MPQVEIYEMLKKESLTTKEMADRLGVRTSTINMSVRKLIKAGLVESAKLTRKEKGRQFIYRVVKK